MKPTIALIACAGFAAQASAFPILNRTILKSFYETGDKPTQGQFAALIDSNLNLSPDGVEYENWAGVEVGSLNDLYDDSSLDSLSTMDARVIGSTGGLVQGLPERTITLDFAFTNGHGLWTADAAAVFRSNAPDLDMPEFQTLVWTLDAPVTFSLGGNPAAGQITMTAQTTLETTLLPSPASGLLLVGGVLAVRRRR